MTPLILLAFANDRQGQFLRSIAEEQRSIGRALDPLVQQQLVQVEVLPNASANDIFEAFRQFGDRIQVFHYGGHAQDLELLLRGAEAGVDMEGFAQFLGQQKGLELVFMNGCATAGQAPLLQAAGIPRLILTETAINDQAAQQFASQFYLGLASGRDVSQSFSEAEGATQAQLGGTRRSLVWEDDASEDAEAFPWRLHQHTAQAFSLPIKAPFPIRRVLAGAAILLLFAVAGYGIWRFALPFDLAISVQYPAETQETHFAYNHSLAITLPDETMTLPLPSDGRIAVGRLTGRGKPVPIHLQSPIWTVPDSQLMLQGQAQSLRLEWKPSLREIHGRVYDEAQQNPLVAATIVLGMAHTETDVSGNFVLSVPNEQVAQISHRLRVSHPDYQPRNWTVNLADGQEHYEIPLMRRIP